MSVIPGSAPEQQAHPPLTEKRGRQSRFWPICFAIFAFEIGVFLLIFPWMNAWNFSYFRFVSPAVQRIWDDAYFRGALSGLGAANLYVALREAVRLLRGSV
jgi:hypothetical protein